LRDGNGVLLRSNDNWKDQKRADIEVAAIAPTKDSEAAVLAARPPGPYATLVASKNDAADVALVEIYNLC
jgi:hypothetical protein